MLLKINNHNGTLISEDSTRLVCWMWQIWFEIPTAMKLTGGLWTGHYGCMNVCASEQHGVGSLECQLWLPCVNGFPPHKVGFQTGIMLCFRILVCGEEMNCILFMHITCFQTFCTKDQAG